MSTNSLPPPSPGAMPTAVPGASVMSGSQPWWRPVIDPWVSGRAWLEQVHLLADLAVGIGLFTIVVTALAVAAGMSVTIVGLPLFVITMLSMRWLGAVERGRAMVFLGHRVPQPHWRPMTGSWWQRTKSAMVDPAAWKVVAYCLLMLPWGIITFTVVVVAWSVSLSLLTVPLWTWVFPDNNDVDVDLPYWMLGRSAAGIAASVGVTLVGVVLTVLTPWAVRGLAKVDRAMVSSLLGGDPNEALRERVSELTQSRDASVTSATTELKRIERDLHDGAQQRLVSLAMDLGLAREQLAAGSDPAEAAPLVARAHDEAKAAIAELRDLVRGIHPSVLTDRGLDAAISGLVSRCPVPVEVVVDLPSRPPSAVEATAYFVVAEALTNIAKHSRATKGRVEVRRDGDHLVVQISDNGSGGADIRPGGGLAGLRDRVAAVEGRLALASPVGGPTMLMVDLPCVW